MLGSRLFACSLVWCVGRDDLQLDDVDDRFLFAIRALKGEVDQYRILENLHLRVATAQGAMDQVGFFFHRLSFLSKGIVGSEGVKTPAGSSCHPRR